MAHKINHILYAGVFVKSDQIDPIKENIIPADFKSKDNYKAIEFPHVTAFFHTDMPIELMQYILNHNEVNFKIVVDGFGQTDKVIALRVFKVTCDEDGTILQSTNKQQHITLAVAGDGKPVDANNITNWTPIDPFVIPGYSRIIYKPAPKKKTT